MCIRDSECLHQPCQNNATCKDGINQFSCQCQTGFEGDLCQNKTDFCKSTPCLNNGTCINEDDGFACQCLAGLTGRTCGVDIDECQLHKPCRNNATCADLLNDYKCLCKPGKNDSVIWIKVSEFLFIFFLFMLQITEEESTSARVSL